MRYPNITINIDKLKHNANIILKQCSDYKITPFIVTKVLSGNKHLVNTLIDCGYNNIADSRIENLKTFKDLKCTKILLRSPSLMNNDIRDVIKYSNISLESELDTIKKENLEALKQNKIHNIILMFDLGDLREGIFYQDDYFKVVKEILLLKNINLLGIGTNLTCYGGIIPTPTNMKSLIDIKYSIEKAFNINLSVISGGNSSSIYFLDQLPKEINNLRLGEVVFLGRETAYGNYIKNLYDDVFKINAKIIELKTKPSLPIGKSNLNAFGETVNIIDEGIMKRAILALGRQDIFSTNLFPIDKYIEIIGQSSDHLLINLNETNYRLNDTISFKVNYGGLLQAMTSIYIDKVYINNKNK